MKDDDFVAIPYVVLRSPVFNGLTASARSLYICMKAEADLNQSIDHVEFGASSVPSIPKATYYRAVRKLIEAGFVDVVEAMGHGKKGIYDLTTRRWGSA